MEFSGLGLVIICLIAGVLLRAWGRVGPDGHRALNAFVLHLPLPALVLLKMHALARTPSALSGAWLPVSMAWLQFALALALVRAVRGPLKLTRAAQGALVLTAGLGNTAFIGYPLVESLLGHSALPTAVLVDQPGTFLVFATLGVWAAAHFSGASSSWRASLKKVVAFPPFLALVAAVVLAPVQWPGAFERTLDRLASALVPVALVSVGLQLRLQGAALRRWGPALGAGLLFKLALVPAALAGLYVLVLGQHGPTVQVTVLESAMSPMVTAAVLAEDAGLDAELASLMVGVGTLVSLVTVPLWAALW